MDLALYLRVIWRFRLLVLAGLLLAVVLSLFSYTRVELGDGAPRLTYRDPHIYESRGLLLLTQAGFPLGRAVFDEVVPIESGADERSYIPRYADPLQFTHVAVLYADIFMSDEVQKLLEDAAPNATIRANPVLVDQNTALPEVEITSVAETPDAAQTGAARAAETFRRYLAREQAANKIKPDNRVVLNVLTRASEPALVSGPPITRPAVVFFAVMSAILALAFVLENLRPRVRPLARHDEGISELPEARRSA